jgi:hypothetical protein
MEPRDAPKVGQKIDVAFKTENLHFFDMENGAPLR